MHFALGLNQVLHAISDPNDEYLYFHSSTCAGTMKIALMLRALGMSAIPLNGNMSQNKRLGSLNKFKAKSREAAIQLNLIRLFRTVSHTTG